MKGLVTWLLGDELGESTIKGWNWLLEVPPDRSATKGKTSDELTIEHMTQLLESMRLDVVNIQSIVEQFYQDIQQEWQEYHLKWQYCQELKQIILANKQQKNMLEARLKMAKLIQIKRILPDLEANLIGSQERLVSVNEIYLHKEADVVLLEADLRAVKMQLKTNNLFNNHQELEKSRDLLVLQERFRNTQAEIETRHQQIQIEARLAHPSNCQLGETMNIQAIDEEIAKLEDE
jgi:hypothetical protein